MMSFKKMLPLLGLLILSTVTFIACEQDLLQDEAEFGEIEYREDSQLRPKKKFAEVLCLPTGDSQHYPKSCQGMGSTCRKVKACRDVQKLSKAEYDSFLRESFSD